uniref:Myb-like domain-containing protein n=1 Tax=Globodera rostochiensis TaxID=31243 RepID=A0A914H420_GLORO
MNAQKLVDYSLSASEIEDASELTPIQFRGKRVHRYIIRSPSVDLAGPLEQQPTTKVNKKKDIKKHFGTTRTFTTSTSSSTSQKTTTTTAGGGAAANAMAQPPSLASTTTFGASRSPSVDLGSLGRMVAEREEALGRDKPRAKKRWTADETKKLKLALKIAGDPTTDETWELISRSIGGHRTVDECRDQAAKQLRWKPPPPPLLPPGSSSTSSSTNQQKATTTSDRSISAGTRQRRKSRRSSDVYSKFFRENVDISFGELDLDDTLIKAVFTTPPEQVKCMRRPFMLRPINPLEDVEDNSWDSSSPGGDGGLGQ